MQDNRYECMSHMSPSNIVCLIEGGILMQYVHSSMSDSVSPINTLQMQRLNSQRATQIAKGSLLLFYISLCVCVRV